MLGEIEWLYSRIVGRCLAMAMSETGHSRQFDYPPVTSALTTTADIIRHLVTVRAPFARTGHTSAAASR